MKRNLETAYAMYDKKWKKRILPRKNKDRLYYI